MGPKRRVISGYTSVASVRQSQRTQRTQRSQGSRTQVAGTPSQSQSQYGSRVVSGNGPRIANALHPPTVQPQAQVHVALPARTVAPQSRPQPSPLTRSDSRASATASDHRGDGSQISSSHPSVAPLSGSAGSGVRRLGVDSGDGSGATTSQQGTTAVRQTTTTTATLPAKPGAVSRPTANTRTMRAPASAPAPRTVNVPVLPDLSSLGPDELRAHLQKFADELKEVKELEAAHAMKANEREGTISILRAKLKTNEKTMFKLHQNIHTLEAESSKTKQRQNEEVQKQVDSLRDELEFKELELIEASRAKSAVEKKLQQEQEQSRDLRRELGAQTHSRVSASMTSPARPTRPAANPPPPSQPASSTPARPVPFPSSQSRRPASSHGSRLKRPPPPLSSQPQRSPAHRRAVDSFTSDFADFDSANPRKRRLDVSGRGEQSEARRQRSRPGGSAAGRSEMVAIDMDDNDFDDAGFEMDVTGPPHDVSNANGAAGTMTLFQAGASTNGEPAPMLALPAPAAPAAASTRQRLPGIPEGVLISLSERLLGDDTSHAAVLTIITGREVGADPSVTDDDVVTGAGPSSVPIETKTSMRRLTRTFTSASSTMRTNQISPTYPAISAAFQQRLTAVLGGSCSAAHLLPQLNSCIRHAPSPQVVNSVFAVLRALLLSSADVRLSAASELNSGASTVEETNEPHSVKFNNKPHLPVPGTTGLFISRPVMQHSDKTAAPPPQVRATHDFLTARTTGPGAQPSSSSFKGKQGTDHGAASLWKYMCEPDDPPLSPQVIRVYLLTLQALFTAPLTSAGISRFRNLFLNGTFDSLFSEWSIGSEVASIACDTLASLLRERSLFLAIRNNPSPRMLDGVDHLLTDPASTVYVKLSAMHVINVLVCCHGDGQDVVLRKHIGATESEATICPRLAMLLDDETARLEEWIRAPPPRPIDAGHFAPSTTAREYIQTVKRNFPPEVAARCYLISQAVLVLSILANHTFLPDELEGFARSHLLTATGRIVHDHSPGADLCYGQIRGLAHRLREHLGVVVSGSTGVSDSQPNSQ